MAGHNKWSKIKRQKAREDKRKSKIWARLTREITVAAREGGGDPEKNPTLSTAIEQAKDANMPKDNIIRAIKRGTGELDDGGDYEAHTYEGYSSNGVAIFVEALTDNLNRTAADVRYVFNKMGGNLGQAGSVDYLFDRKGIIKIPTNGYDEMEVFEVVVDAGAEDLRRDNGAFVVTTGFTEFSDVKKALSAADIEEQKATLVRVPTTTVTVDESDVGKVENLVEELDELDDVQNIYTTLEVDGEVLRVVSEDDDDE
jgi:YebC/PmpR family DNA-binding regulatory protein